jgi:hypothetical protein
MVMPDGSWRNICAAGHDTTILLSADASHCISCRACYSARHAAHELINGVYGDFAEEAGLRVKLNPSTEFTMGNKINKTQARVLYPDRTTPASKAKTAELHRALEIVAGPEVALHASARETIRRIAAECPKNFKGLKVDNIIQSSTFCIWGDVGVVHTTAPSIIDAQIRFVTQLAAAELAAGGNHARNVLSGHISPPLARYSRHKTVKYQPLVNGAIAQIKAGDRTLRPLFTPLIFSHMGEMSPAAVETVEVITKAYKSSLSRVACEDGISIIKKTSAFRARFKDALMVANANGFGTTLAVAGAPMAGARAAAAYDHGGLPPWELVLAHG